MGKRRGSEGGLTPEQTVLFPVKIQAFFTGFLPFTVLPESSKNADRSLNPDSPAGGGYAQDLVHTEGWVPGPLW